MANRKSTRRLVRNKKRQTAIGLLFFELIGVVAFAALVTTARSQREASLPTTESAVSPVMAAQSSAGGWNQHRPRFSQVIGELWEAGF